MEGGFRPNGRPGPPKGPRGEEEPGHRAVSERFLPKQFRGADNVGAEMDDLTFSARRAGTAAPARAAAEPSELDARFRTLVQSPLRAGILRYLSARLDESFDVESLMQTFGRLRLDVENCVQELVDFGAAEVIEIGRASCRERV